MYLIVEMKDGEIIWSDSRLSKSKASANMRKEMITKQTKKEYQIIRMSKYQIVA